MWKIKNMENKVKRLLCFLMIFNQRGDLYTYEYLDEKCIHILGAPIDEIFLMETFKRKYKLFEYDKYLIDESSSKIYDTNEINWFLYAVRNISVLDIIEIFNFDLFSDREITYGVHTNILSSVNRTDNNIIQEIIDTINTNSNLNFIDEL